MDGHNGGQGSVSAHRLRVYESLSTCFDHGNATSARPHPRTHHGGVWCVVTVVPLGLFGCRVSQFVVLRSNVSTPHTPHTHRPPPSSTTTTAALEHTRSTWLSIGYDVARIGRVQVLVSYYK